MGYVLQYGQIWPYLPRLLDGAVLALQIAVLAFCGGLLIGTLFAAIKSLKVRRRVVELVKALAEEAGEGKRG